MLRTLTPWTHRQTHLPGKFEMELPAMFERFFGPEDEWWTNNENFVPRVDVVETPQAVEVTMELPGMKATDVQVEMLEGRLMIHGEKQDEKVTSDKTYHRVERRYGEFRRIIPLATAIDAEKIAAEFKDGVRRVTVPKVPAAQPKAIEVKG